MAIRKINELNIPKDILSDHFNFDPRNEEIAIRTLTKKPGAVKLKPQQKARLYSEQSLIHKPGNFISVLISGGRATRFKGNLKVLYEIPDPKGGNKKYSLLELNILQLIKYEKQYKVSVPLIIFDDFYRHSLIEDYIKRKKYFRRNSSTYQFIKQTSGSRYIVKNNTPNLFVTNNIDDSFSGMGHFCFNDLINSLQFKNLLRNNCATEYVVVSNCDNIGQKYFSELLSPNSGNCCIVCPRKEQNVDGLYVSKGKNLIKPYFLKSKFSSSFGFTGTCYIKLLDLLKAYGYSSVKEYLCSCTKKYLPCHYWPIYKSVIYNNKEITTVHAESPLAEISRFIKFTPISIHRDRCFFPTKKLEDLNSEKLKRVARSVKKYNYL